MDEEYTTTKFEKHDWSRFDAMTDKEVHEAVLQDPDARPMTEEEFARAKRVPQVKTLRRALGLTQEKFAAHYRIPLGTLRDWEQGRSEPDQPARAYLTVIAHDPEGVRRAHLRPIKPEEKRAEEFLAHTGYHNIVYEPDGNVTPDFLVDGRIAVEVRRLNQNIVSSDRSQGLETDFISLSRIVKSLALSFGPPIQGVSWFLHFRFRRPIKRPKVLKRELLDALQKFINSETHEPISVQFGSGFRLDIHKSSAPHSTFFILGSWIDRDATVWLIPEIVNNLRVCISDKANNIANLRSKYPECWLILIDRVSRFALDDADWEEIRAQLPAKIDAWDRVIVIDPEAPQPAFRLLKGDPSRCQLPLPNQ